MTEFLHRTITFVGYATGEIAIRLDSAVLDGDDRLTLDVVMSDPEGGLYFRADDSQRLADFMSPRTLTTAPGVK